MRTTVNLHNNWQLTYNGKTIPATVPGDINLDLYNAGHIENPYYGINHQQLGWILKTDFEYSTIFDVSKEMLANEQILLQFDSIDTFAEIYLNGTLLGKTENMFLQYSFDVKPYLKETCNNLVVKMISTANVMDTFDERTYFACFNVKRLFIRKAQCHFGWDWAPDMPGYGICGDVRLVGACAQRIDNTSYKTHNNGKVSIFAELNYSTRPHINANRQVVDDSGDCKNDQLRFLLAKTPNQDITEDNAYVCVVPVEGYKNFVNFQVDNVQLWWPVGYGEHPTYQYKVQILRNGNVVDEKTDHLAFREIKLIQEPIDNRKLSYKINVNGTDIFVKGSNWVPAECFIGSIKEEKYHTLISQAVDANFNMLRVWGGGLYEKDIFYNTCDQLGVMVWQDLMFACADIPEDIPEYVEICKKEIEYQIKRLRNHPSIVYWCGGNEKTGSYGLKVSRGEYFIDVLLRGIVSNLDSSRPYARQSPCSMTDVGNDATSGECHAGSWESSLIEGIDKYRDNVSHTSVPVISECAIMGPGSLESLKKIFPTDKLWPINEYWDDRLMENPHSSFKVKFPERQRMYVNTLYGECSSVEEFIAKGMTVHAETMRAEMEYARANKATCGGFMNWMYSDIWPSATWAVVDYYCEPKQVYYQMKRSYEPLLLTFVQRQNNVTELTVVNDLQKDLSFEVTFGQKTLDGATPWQKQERIQVPTNGTFALPVEVKDCANSYLFVEAIVEDKKYSTVYSPSMWHNCKFQSDYTYNVEYANDVATVTIHANKFAKGVTLRLPDNYKYRYSDNYVDIQAGEQAIIRIYNVNHDQLQNLVVTDFAKETK